LNSQAPQPSFSAGRAPLFLLSFRYRDELVESAERTGWHAIAARRAESIERRFIASGATIAVVDARGAFDQGLAAVGALAEPAEANAAALVMLLSRGDVGKLDQVFAAGATHYLASPFGEPEFAQVLRFAGRHVTRLGGVDPAEQQRELAEEANEWWRWQPGRAEIELSPALAHRLPKDVQSARGIFRLLDNNGRVAALRALRRVRDTGRSTAFAHHAPGSRPARIAQHLYPEPDTGAIVGRIEDLEDTAGSPRTATRDPLTGLADRQAALKWIEQAIEQCDDQANDCFVLLLSISRFDAINATYGRATGDALIRATARRIERLARGFGSRRYLVARLAGAEFAVGLLGPSQDGEAYMLAEQLGATATRPFASGNHVVSFSCRVGGTRVEDGERDPALLLRRASAALAEAKASETGLPQLLDSSGHAASEVASRLEIDLRSALEKDEIEILFQPQLSITTGAVIGVEALARWQHPILGELGAVPLFAAAARSDYLVPLSRHVHRKALEIATAHQSTFRWLRLSINVTAADIAQPDFAAQFLAMVDESAFDRRRLTVEITESGLIEDLSAAGTLLARLRSAGLKVAIDDFGTGYSSLAYLKALPLDYLKIDQQLSQDIAGSARDRVVVSSVIEMARSLGLSVVAEGVENEEQLSLLAQAGCNVYQGFIFSPPITADELSRMMKGKKVAAS
jgi:diguanylate cyclase (GGDEF)-like protein